ncbi:MAG: thiol:disulfide interchange protein DsbA/DsbL [Dokdonella sp.]|uniref:thiol:disulfide interchange protein DsbA/DsbL n=1 Tax=Dokdonella sp. TaxID=2291710 RepID=UPI00326344A6
MFVRLLILTAAFASAPAVFAADAAAPKWEAGKAYQLIDPPQPTSTGKKIEVLEVFSYACPHCAHFQPAAEKLKAALPKNAQFTLMPADFQPRWVAFARAFYVAQGLHLIEKTHQEMFEAIYRDNLPMNSLDDIAGFYAQHGANKESFLSTAQSFVIDGDIARIREREVAYGIESTPTLVINGKYRVTANAEQKIGFDEMVDIALFLVNKESAAAKTP